MSSAHRLVVLLAVLALALPAGCTGSTAPAERVAVMDIAPQRVPCVGSHPQQCLRVRMHPDTTWYLFYEGIEGFVFEPGFEYTVRVAIRRVENPPADSSSLSYRLLAVLRREPAE